MVVSEALPRDEAGVNGYGILSIEQESGRRAVAAPGVTFVLGPAGTGKTAVALQAARDVPAERVLAVNCWDVGSLDEVERHARAKSGAGFPGAVIIIDGLDEIRFAAWGGHGWPEILGSARIHQSAQVGPLARLHHGSGLLSCDDDGRRQPGACAADRAAGMSAKRCIISVMSRYVIRGPLTYELAQKDSPIRQFFDARLGRGLKDVQADYRATVGPILVPGVPRKAADAGTIGTAADWMMRFLVHPSPSLGLAVQGASLCGMQSALKELALMLGFRDAGTSQFSGPAQGTGMEPGLLHRICWALALLTEVYRRGPDIAAIGPIGRLPRKSAQSLLEAAPDAGLEQLAALRGVMESALLPAVGSRRGLWAIGPAFAGSEIMRGDADLVAGGLLTELKTTVKKPSLGVTDLWQMLGYVLMDYVDEFDITDVALFSARYGYLAQWNLDTLLSHLAGRPVTVTALRAEFRALLEACRR